MAEYYMAAPEIEEKLISFLKGRKPTMYAKAQLAGEVLRDIGVDTTDIVRSVLMMQSLQDLYDQREDYVEVS